MFDRAQTRMLPVVTRANEQAPMVAACCNACRTCWTSNILGMFAAAGTAVAAFLVRRRKHAP